MNLNRYAHFFRINALPNKIPVFSSPFRSVCFGTVTICIYGYLALNCLVYWSGEAYLYGKVRVRVRLRLQVRVRITLRQYRYTV